MTSLFDCNSESFNLLLQHTSSMTTTNHRLTMLCGQTFPWNAKQRMKWAIYLQSGNFVYSVVITQGWNLYSGGGSWREWFSSCGHCSGVQLCFEYNIIISLTACVNYALAYLWKCKENITQGALLTHPFAQGIRWQ